MASGLLLLLKGLGVSTGTTSDYIVSEGGLGITSEGGHFLVSEG